MKITLLNGREIDVTKNGVYWLSHVIPSIDLEHNIEDVDGRDGGVLLSTTYKQRTITARFLYDVLDIQDFYLLRDELNSLFVRKESFYITFKEEPYRRWLVRLAQQFEMTPSPQMESFEISFITVNIFGESVSTTKSLKEWDVGLWAWDGSINWEDELKYIHNTNEFTIRNLGTAPINPKQNELQIIIKGNFTSRFTLINNTTGETYFYDGTLVNSDTLVIDGVNTLLNGNSVFSRTNKRLITLNSGINNFTIQGGTIQSIEFNFRFLYL